MKFPTPHPRKFGKPNITESTLTSGSGARSAFVDVTQRPRMAPSRRMSHPLSRAISPFFQDHLNQKLSRFLTEILYHGLPFPS